MTTKILSGDKLRWFAAETLIIVLGILIALSLDDYRSDRQDRVMAIEYVERLQGSIIADLRYVQDIWKPGLRAKREAMEAILPVVRGQESAPEDIEKFLKNISMGGIAGASKQGWVADHVFQDLISTGNLRLIRDSELRGRISQYYGYSNFQFERLRGRHTEYVSYVHTIIPAELRDDVDLAAYEGFGIDYALNRILSNDFRNLANAEYNMLLFSESLDFESLANSLLEDLEQYLNELEG